MTSGTWPMAPHSGTEPDYHIMHHGIEKKIYTFDTHDGNMMNTGLDECACMHVRC